MLLVDARRGLSWPLLISTTLLAAGATGAIGKASPRQRQAEGAFLGQIHDADGLEALGRLAPRIAAAPLGSRTRAALLHLLAERASTLAGPRMTAKALATVSLPALTRFTLGLPFERATGRPPPPVEGTTPLWRRAHASDRARAWSKRPLLLFLVLDGLRAELLDFLLARGELPVIRRELVDRGLSVDRFLACFPTVTPPNAATMLTGVLPDVHRIPALAWYDKGRREARLYTSVAGRAINRDLPREVRDLWEWLRTDYRVHTVGVPLERGADTRWFQLFYPASWITRLTRGYLRPGRRPFATCLWYTHLDTRSHLKGALSEGALGAIRTFDDQLGRLVATLRGRGIHDRTVLVLTSDHGMNPTVVNRDLAGHLRSLGLRLSGLNLSIDPLLPAAMNARLRRGGSVVINVGAGSASLYLEGITPGQDPGPRLRHYPTPRGPVDLVRHIQSLDAVDLILYRITPRPAPDRTWEVAVVGRHGEGRIRMTRGPRGARVAYRVVLGIDPLALPAGLLGRDHPARDLALSTSDGPYPGAVPAIGAALAAERLGDVVVTTRPGYNFSRHFHSRGGYHGGQTRGEAVTRLLIAGPGVPHTRIPAATMADLTPTILAVLGLGHDPAQFDGVSLVDQVGRPSRRPP